MKKNVKLSKNQKSILSEALQADAIQGGKDDKMDLLKSIVGKGSACDPKQGVHYADTVYVRGVFLQTEL